MDFSAVLAGLDVVTAVLALIYGGTVMVAIRFAIWAARQVATFFDSRSGGHGPSEAQMIADGFCGQCFSKPCQCDLHDSGNWRNPALGADGSYNAGFFDQASRDEADRLDREEQAEAKRRGEAW